MTSEIIQSINHLSISSFKPDCVGLKMETIKNENKVNSTKVKKATKWSEYEMVNDEMRWKLINHLIKKLNLLSFCSSSNLFNPDLDEIVPIDEMREIWDGEWWDGRWQILYHFTISFHLFSITRSK